MKKFKILVTEKEASKTLEEFFMNLCKPKLLFKVSNTNNGGCSLWHFALDPCHSKASMLSGMIVVIK